jgi:hypothetical protein
LENIIAVREPLHILYDHLPTILAMKGNGSTLLQRKPRSRCKTFGFISIDHISLASTPALTVLVPSNRTAKLFVR